MGKNLVFWIGSRLWEVVACERWSHMEVRLYPALRARHWQESRRYLLNTNFTVYTLTKGGTARKSPYRPLGFISQHFQVFHYLPLSLFSPCKRLSSHVASGLNPCSYVSP